MARQRTPRKKKKLYTATEANAALPLVRQIVQDISTLAHHLRERHQWLEQITQAGQARLTPAHAEELRGVKDELERDGERLQEYVVELDNLGVELKDYFLGLVDFRSKRDGREVYLCWKLGEAEVAHWHELNAGFQGRQCLMSDTSKV